MMDFGEGRKCCRGLMMDFGGRLEVLTTTVDDASGQAGNADDDR
jgi:hypothetical protein